jgi:hypothetical protein
VNCECECILQNFHIYTRSADVKQGKDDYDDADADAYENSNSVKEKSVHTLTRT